MELQKGDIVKINGELWDCKVQDEYNYVNAIGTVINIGGIGWPLIKIGNDTKRIAWDHITKP